MLSFVPQYHIQIVDGELAGAWLPTYPPASVKTDVFRSERMREGVRIQNEGGTIAIVDPMGDYSMLEQLIAEMDAAGRIGSREEVQNFLRVGRKRNDGPAAQAKQPAPYYRQFSRSRF